MQNGGPRSGDRPLYDFRDGLNGAGADWGPRSKEEIMYGKLQSFYNQQLVERLFLEAEAPYLSL